MKKSKLLSFILLLSFIVSPLFSGVPQAEAKAVPEAVVNTTPSTQGTAPNDEFGTSSTTGQMRTTTMAMRIAAASHLNLARGGSVNQYAGISPDSSYMSPLAKLGGVLAEMVQNVALPDYFGVANWANSPLPTLSNGVVTGGVHKFTTALPVFCPLGTNALGQCIPVGIPDTTTFPGSDYYEIAVVEYREQMSPDLPAPGTKLRGYVQVVPSSFTGAVPC